MGQSLRKKLFCLIEQMVNLTDLSWRELAKNIMKDYQEQTDGSWIEDKEYGLVWHYENADPDYGEMQAREMQNHLLNGVGKSVSVMRYDSNHILEVIPAQITKGWTAKEVVDRIMYPKGTQAEGFASPLRRVSGDTPDSRRGSFSPSPKSFMSGMTPPSTSTMSRTPSSTFLRSPSPASTSNSSLIPNVKHCPAEIDDLPVDPFFTPVSALMSQACTQYPFVLCFGDDRSDEDMFITAKNLWPATETPYKNIFTCVVGTKPSQAQYYVTDDDMVFEILDALTNSRC